jgi:CRISPR-associated endonuclease/helicase Cas3
VRDTSLEEFVRDWLRHRLHGPDRAATPRRLVVALAPGAVVEPTAAEVTGSLTDLDLVGAVALYVIGGQPDGPARASGASASGSDRLDWRMDMHRPAIVLGPADALVSRALNRGFGAHRDLWPIEFALLTNGAQWVVTDADQCPQSTLTLGRLVELAGRWPTAEPLRLTALAARPAPRTMRLPHPPEDAVRLAASARRWHRPGTRTLLALPTLATARAAYAAMATHTALAATVKRECTLLHPYFRPADRARMVERLAIADQIVVATEAAAAGVGARAAQTLTATAPARPVPELSIVDFEDVRARFDTDPGTEASTVDEFVLDSDGEAQLAWAHWTPVDASGRPPGEARPDAAARCRAPLAEVRALAERAAIWRFDPAAGAWTPVTGAAPPRPGEILLVAADAGGYDPVTGIDPAVTAPVPGCPTLDLALAPLEPAPVAGFGWLSLDRHSTDVRDQARFLVGAIDPALPPDARDAVATAGYAHDAGKWHPVWQDALCALASDEERDAVAAGRPWAKSGIEAPLEFADGARFRHELASLLLLDGPLQGLLTAAADPDLVRYLVLAHHGKLRWRVDPAPLGIVPGRATATPAMFGQPAGVLTEDVTRFVDGKWHRTVDDLLGRYGPFLLAYLETLVRMADWRASAGRGLDR